MINKSMLFTLLGTLAFGVAFSQQNAGLDARASYPQDTGISYPQDPVMSAEAASSFDLRGILITRSSRAAMLNGKVLREGDVLNGAEILAIAEREVRIRIGSEERILRVGSTVIPGQARPPQMHIVRNVRPVPNSPQQERPISVEPAPVPTLATADVEERIHNVRQGETLSGIAENYLVGNTTRNQVTIALFAANPQAFRGNINALRAGAKLRIPSEQEMQRQTAAAATAEVVAQTDRWRGTDVSPVRLAGTTSERPYGPVTYGDTLSGIAEEVLREGFSLDQMVIALFDANPQAFDGNINALHQGALLRIPDDSELKHRAHSTASAEVVAQTIAWRNRAVQQARSDDLYTRVTAATVSSPQAFVPPFE